MKWDNSALIFVMFFLIVKCWLITLNSVSMFNKILLKFHLNFIKIVSSTILLNIVSIFVYCSVDVETSIECSFFWRCCDEHSNIIRVSVWFYTIINIMFSFLTLKTDHIWIAFWVCIMHIWCYKDIVLSFWQYMYRSFLHCKSVKFPSLKVSSRCSGRRQWLKRFIM